MLDLENEHTRQQSSIQTGTQTGSPVGSDQAARVTELQFVTFHLGKEIFALPMGSVKEIIRMPQVAAVPLSPPSMEGLANLRGLLLPVVSLTRLLFSRKKEVTDITRVVVTDIKGACVGFVVDRVDQVVRVSADKVEKATGFQATVESDRLSGVIKGAAGHSMIMMLDAERLVGPEFASLIQRADRGEGAMISGHGADRGTTVDRSEKIIQLVSFMAAGQEYAFPIDRVNEIVRIPENISEVPKSASHVLGIINLRNQLLPLISLRRMFSMPKEELNEQSRVIIISLESSGTGPGGAVGIVTDQVREVLRIPVSLTEEMPALFAKGKNVGEIESICRLQEGRRLVSILSVARLFEHEALREALKMHQEGETNMASRERANVIEKETQLVVFQLAGEEYGVPIEAVQEIIRIPDVLARIPKAPDLIEGMVNLRGLLLPVVDLRTRLGMARVPRNDRQRIMVFTLKGLRTGFIVDSVVEVLKLETRLIESSPNFSADQQRIMRQVANIKEKNRMILILEVEQLMGKDEMQLLANVIS
ncbi:MAG: chemotaxis protein CheW [Magnetococcus sp. YQC-5]